MVSEDDAMKSSKRTKSKEFRPFSKPDMKVRETLSRWASTLSASAFTGAFIIIATEALTVFTIVKTVALMTIGAIMLLSAIYVFKGGQHE